MNLKDDDIIGLNVETVSGFRLGRIKRIEIETEMQQVQRYWVKSSWLSKRLSKTLIIHKDQVVSLTKDKMIVEDLEVGEALKQEGAAISTPQ